MLTSNSAEEYYDFDSTFQNVIAKSTCSFSLPLLPIRATATVSDISVPSSKELFLYVFGQNLLELMPAPLE